MLQVELAALQQGGGKGGEAAVAGVRRQSLPGAATSRAGVPGGIHRCWAHA